MLDKMKFYLEIYNATEVRWSNLELFFPEELVLFQGFWCLSGGAGRGEERGGEERSHEAHQVGKLYKKP
jgi:hypothetical protein